jgi:PAS domain S-box-containing protein
LSQSAYLFLGLTAIVAALSAVLAYAVLRIFAAARAATRDDRKIGAETALMAAAMEDAVRKLRDGERAMKARAEASERLSSEIVASLTSGLLVVDGQGIVRTLNPAGQAMLGFSGTGWEGPYREVLQNAGALADVLEECLTTAKPVVRRAVPLTGGTASHLGLTVSPIREENGGGAHGVICLFTDLTEVMELEEQLRLKDSLARLGEMTAGIAHEFRNGLATIHGYGRLIDLERLPPDYRPFVQGIRDETEALGQVVTNFLNFARPTELALAPVDMAALAERAADEVRADARARGGDVIVRGEFGRVEGDEVLLRQAMSNLCRNAFEACDQAKVSPQIVIEGQADAVHGAVRISVSDNGPGVPESVADRVFRPFFTTKAHGTGLGLALVQKIIVTHNGRVTVGNEDGGGARFVVTLPASVAVLEQVDAPAR